MQFPTGIEGPQEAFKNRADPESALPEKPRAGRMTIHSHHGRHRYCVTVLKSTGNLFKSRENQLRKYLLRFTN